jgi:hypothetical protein
LLLFLFVFLVVARVWRRISRHGTTGRWHRRHEISSSTTSRVVRSQTKPAWVRAELIRLKA